MNLRRIAVQHLLRSGCQIAQSRRDSFPKSVYIICTSPRSGSWLLCDGLAATSVAGNPREWFNALEEQQCRARWRLDREADLGHASYFELARAESTTPNGISGVKLHYNEFLDLPKRLEHFEHLRGLSLPHLMSKVFPNARYLWLTRRDKKRQAISHRIALITNEWWAIDGVRNNKWEDLPPLEFDAQAIARLEANLVENDTGWQSYFHDHHIVPLVVHYEDLVADYSGNIRRVLRWLGIPNAETFAVPPPRLKRQSNAVNDEWYAQYLKFRGTPSDPMQSPTSDANDRAALERVHQTIPTLWKQWIAKCVMLKTRDDEIVKVLVDNGYGRDSAQNEVARAKIDPYLIGAARTLQTADKSVAMLNVLSQVAGLAKGVERRRNVSRHEFLERYYAANRPVILQDLMTDWRAMTAWTPDYLKRVIGDQTVAVMARRDASDQCDRYGHKHSTAMRFADYVDLIYSGKVTNDYYLVANNGLLQKPAGQPLFRDFTAFPEYLDPTHTAQQSFFWFGPPGTVTTLHHDTSNILMAQVAGRKRFLLVPAAQQPYVYNDIGVWSEVDGERPDLKRHPKFRNATVFEVVLDPGEVLFVPVGWWHCVRALDVSIMVSFTNFVFPNHFNWGE